MTNNAELMYDTRPPPSNRPITIVGDGSTRKKVEFIGEVGMIFHINTEYPAILYNVSFVPGLRGHIFSFHVVQEHQEKVLNRGGAHLVNGRLTFLRKENGSYIRATRVHSGQNVGRRIALATFDGRPPPSSSVFSSSPSPNVFPHPSRNKLKRDRRDKRSCRHESWRLNFMCFQGNKGGILVCTKECFYDSPPPQTVDCMKQKIMNIYHYRRPN